MPQAMAGLRCVPAPEMFSGWWCQNHLEKYEFVNGKDDIPIMENKQDGSHEPECIHVLGLRVQTSAKGKRAFFLRIVLSYRLSEST